jgi:hypothetical protein
MTVLTIPTLQLKSTATVLVDNPTGTIIATGQTDLNTGWIDLTANYTYSVFELYEDGAPLANGRTFQVSGFPSLASPPVRTGNATPWEQVPNFLEYTKMNLPVTFITDDTRVTCFFAEPDLPGSNAAFFLGQFRVGGNGIIPPYMIPLFIDPADVAGTVLAGYTQGLPSTLNNWMLASGQPAQSEALLPTPYRETQALVGAQTNINERMAVALYDDTGTGTTFCDPSLSQLHVNNTLGRSMRRLLGMNPIDLRTYRRTDAHATYDWAGKWPA